MIVSENVKFMNDMKERQYTMSDKMSGRLGQLEMFRYTI